MLMTGVSGALQGFACEGLFRVSACVVAGQMQHSDQLRLQGGTEEGCDRPHSRNVTIKLSHAEVKVIKRLLLIFLLVTCRPLP